MLREWIKKAQSVAVGLLKLAAREGKIDHVKHVPNRSMIISERWDCSQNWQKIGWPEESYQTNLIEPMQPWKQIQNENDADHHDDDYGNMLGNSKCKAISKKTRKSRWK